MRILLFLCAAVLITSCETGKKTPTLAFKYADKEQSITCETQNNALLNEALYSFEADLISNYDPETLVASRGYARFLYPGMTGNAEYERLPSKHSLQILEKLKAENIILIAQDAKSNLNYEHPAVVCIIDNIEDGAIRQTIKSLLEVGGMNPAMFNGRMRNKGRDLEKQRNLAMYVALDAYYQNLVTIDWTAQAETTTE